MQHVSFMFLGPHTKRKMNELWLKTDLTEVAYFVNRLKKIGGLICQ